MLTFYCQTIKWCFFMHSKQNKIIMKIFFSKTFFSIDLNTRGLSILLNHLKNSIDSLLISLFDWVLSGLIYERRDVTWLIINLSFIETLIPDRKMERSLLCRIALCTPFLLTKFTNEVVLRVACTVLWLDGCFR